MADWSERFQYAAADLYRYARCSIRVSTLKNAARANHAWNLADHLARLKTPIIATVSGEGGSASALAIGRLIGLMMLQYSKPYSVISPEAAPRFCGRNREAADAAEKSHGYPPLSSEGASKLVDNLIAEAPGWRTPASRRKCCAHQGPVAVSWMRLEQLPAGMSIGSRRR